MFVAFHREIGNWSTCNLATGLSHVGVPGVFCWLPNFEVDFRITHGSLREELLTCSQPTLVTYLYMWSPDMDYLGEAPDFATLLTKTSCPFCRFA